MKPTETQNEDEDGALTLEQQREQLAETIFRIINEMAGAPKWCRAPVCKRARRCLDPARPCEADMPPSPPISDEEKADNLFAFKRALEAEVARRAAQREAEAEATSSFRDRAKRRTRNRGSRA